MAHQNTPTTGKRSFLPHLLILAIFLIIACIFCLPAFQGQVIQQSDFLGWFYTARETMEYYQATGHNSYWLHSAFSGMPSFITAYFSDANWFSKLGRLMLFSTYGLPTNPAGYLFWAMVCFYLLTLSLNINKWLGLIGAIAFAFSSYNPIVIVAGHATKMMDIAMLPGVLAGIIWVYKNKYWLGGIVAGITLALFFAAGHYQIIYYGGILIMVIVIARLVQKYEEGALKQWFLGSVLLLVMAVLAIATGADRTLMTQEYNQHSIRGGNSELTGDMHAKGGGLDKEYAFQWSNGVGETFSLLVPNLYGGGSGENIGSDSHYGETLSSLGVPANQVDQMTMSAPLYWGPQPFLSGPVYFGAIICFLFILSIFVIKDPLKWWFTGAAVFFILLSLGKNFSSFNYPLFDHLPLLNKFRTPSMALSIPSLIFPLMAVWALWDAFSEKITKDAFLKKLKLALYITAGLCIVLLIATYSMRYSGSSDDQILKMGGNNQQIGEKLLSALKLDRASAARSDTFRSLIFILLSAGILWGFAKGKLKKELAIAGLGLLISIDGISVAHRYLNSNNFEDEFVFEQNFQPNEADKEINKDKDPTYRVLNLASNTFNESRTSYFHHSVGGYHPAKLEIYQELIENQLGKLNSSVINMLNTKYLIVPGQGGQEMVRENPVACGPAWFVSNIKWAKDARSAMDALNAPSLSNPSDTAMGIFNPLETAVLRDSLKPKFDQFNFGKSPDASIKVTKYGLDTLEYQTHNTEPGLAVFSEIYYHDGWKAFIDGKEVPIMRTNYVLRAIKVPAGDHKIVFEFLAPGAKLGTTISYTGSILLTLFILMGIGLLVLKFKKEGKGFPVSTQPKIK